MKFIVACCGLLLALLAAPALYAQEVGQDEVVKVKTTLVNVPVIVSDRNGRYIPGLKLEDFTVYQDQKPQAISFFAAEEEPLNVALLLDTSRSTHDVLGKIKDAAKDFIKLLQPADRAMVVSFDYQVNVLSPLTSDHKALEKAVKSVEIGEYIGTVMRDAVQQTVRRLFAGVKGRKAVILLTDGKDAGSYQTKSLLLNQLEESDVLVYSVFYQTGRDFNRPRFDRRPDIWGGGGGVFGRRRGGVWGGGGRRGGGMGVPENRPDIDIIRERQKRADEEAVEYLAAMSDLTAGRFYRKDVTDLKKTFALIADELRQQYRLGYYPSPPDSEAAVHDLKVKVTLPDVAVRARRTYRSTP